MLNIMKPLLPISMAAFVVSCVPQTQTQQTTQAQDPYATPATYPAATQDVQYPASTPTYPEVSTPTYPPVSTPATPSVPAATASGQSYTIQKGDTLWGIGQKFGTSVDAIRSANTLSGDLIQAGQTIVIP